MFPWYYSLEKKPDKIQTVFDPSSEYVNDFLLSGPVTHPLLGVLRTFRRLRKMVVMADWE